jgi:hypothetical protein
VKEQGPLQERLIITHRKVGEIPMADHLALIPNDPLPELPPAVVVFGCDSNVGSNCGADSSELSSDSLDSSSEFGSEPDKERAIAPQFLLAVGGHQTLLRLALYREQKSEILLLPECL